MGGQLFTHTCTYIYYMHIYWQLLRARLNKIKLSTFICVIVHALAEFVASDKLISTLPFASTGNRPMNQGFWTMVIQTPDPAPWSLDLATKWLPQRGLTWPVKSGYN